MANIDPCGCNAILVRNYLGIARTQKERLAVLQSINSETWKKLQSGGGVDADIFGIPLSAGYSQVEEARDSLASSLQVNWSNDEAEYVLWSGLTPEQIQGWTACKLGCAKNSPGFYAWVESYDDTRAVVMYYLNIPPGDEKRIRNGERVRSSQVSGGRAERIDTPAGLALPQGFLFRDESEVAQMYIREPEQSLRIAVSLERYGGVSVEVPYKPDIIDTELPQQRDLRLLREKTVPYGYRLSEGSSEIWTNYNGKRIWVRDAVGITNSAGVEVQLGVEIQPLGAFIEEDRNYHYYRGAILPGPGR